MLKVQQWHHGDGVEWGTPEFTAAQRRKLLAILGDSAPARRFVESASSICTSAILWPRAIAAGGIDNPSAFQRDICSAQGAADDLLRTLPKIQDFLTYYGSAMAQSGPILRGLHNWGGFACELRRLSDLTRELALATKPARGRPAARSAGYNAVIRLATAWRECFGEQATSKRGSLFVAACRLILPAAGLPHADIIGMVRDALAKSAK